MSGSDVLTSDACVASADPAPTPLESLLQRMCDKSDFPALSDSVVRIQSMAVSDKESISSVTNEILKDVALTNKLLRLVNSAHYARDGSVGTVSRAVSLVGFNGIRNMTLSLVLLEHMQDKGNAQLLKEEFLRALMAGTIAAELAGSRAEGEEAFIGALFQNLGRMLAQFYFAPEAARIRQLVGDTARPMTEEAAAMQVLGLNYEALGLGVAQAWGLPASIQRCMVRPVGEPPSHACADVGSQLRWSARAANDMADAMLHADLDVVEQQLAVLSRHYAKVLATAPDQVKAMTTLAREKLSDLADAMDIRVPSHCAAARLLLPATDHETDGMSRRQGDMAIVNPPMVAHRPDTPLDPQAAARSLQALQTLTAGIQDVTNVMVDDFKLGDVLRMILEAMYRALEFQRIVFCLRDPKTNTLTGRFGLGQDVEAVVGSFCIPLDGSGTLDLFATICNKGADTLISDTSDPRIAARLPAWYGRHLHAPGFLILPLVIKGQPVGLIYADRAVKGELTIDEKQLSMLRTLRNQAVMAFRQSN